MRNIGEINSPKNTDFTEEQNTLKNKLVKFIEELKKRGKPPILFPNEKVATSNGFFPGRSKPIKDTKLHHFLMLL